MSLIMNNIITDSVLASLLGIYIFLSIFLSSSTITTDKENPISKFYDINIDETILYLYVQTWLPFFLIYHIYNYMTSSSLISIYQIIINLIEFLWFIQCLYLWLNLTPTLKSVSWNWNWTQTVILSCFFVQFILKIFICSEIKSRYQ